MCVAQGAQLSATETAGRLFKALERIGVQVVMISQASADSSVCVAVAEDDAEVAMRETEREFAAELQRKQIAGVNIETGHSIVAIVGEGMAFRPGVGATFTKAMANARVNIRCIAQGSSERQIAVVVAREDCTRALRAAHAALALSNSQLSIAVVGASGGVGKEFLRMLDTSGLLVCGQRRLPKRKSGGAVIQTSTRDLRVDLKVTAVSRSNKAIQNYDGVDIGAPDLWDAATDSSSLEELTRFLNEDFNGARCAEPRRGLFCTVALIASARLLHHSYSSMLAIAICRVVVDCTDSDEVGEFYPRWLSEGVSVISANKRTGSGPLLEYTECNDAVKDGTSQAWPPVDPPPLLT